MSAIGQPADAITDNNGVCCERVKRFLDTETLNNTKVYREYRYKMWNTGTAVRFKPGDYHIWL